MSNKFLAIFSLFLIGLIAMTKIIGDGNMYLPNEKLNPTDKKGRQHYQSLIQDWAFMLTDYFEYASANRVNLNTMVAVDSFQIGDRIRILQDDDPEYKYFFVVSPGDNYLMIAGGDNFTFTSSPIAEIAFSRIPTPFNWPATEFVYSGMTLAMYPSSDIGASVDGEADAYFSIDNGRITVSYATTTNISTSGNAVNHYCFAQIPDALQVPSGVPADQVVFPTIQTGYADNADDFLVGIGSLVIFEGQVQLGGVFGQATYPWPEFAAIRMGPYTDHKFGNASNSGNSSIKINGSISYIFAE
jgi:hypothetical protein